MDAISSTFGAILSSLQVIMYGRDIAKATEAKGIYAQINSFKFLTLKLFRRVLMCTKSLSDQLQSTQVNMAKAAELVTSVQETLQSFRSDEEWEKLHEYVKRVAALYNISAAPHRPQCKRQIPQRYNVGIVMETIGSCDSSQSMKVSLYFPILDAVIAEMQRRFDSKNLELMKGFQCCVPDSPRFLYIDQLLPVTELYQLNKESLVMECTIAKQLLKEKGLLSINDVLLEIVPMKEAFPVLISLL